MLRSYSPIRPVESLSCIIPPEIYSMASESYADLTIPQPKRPTSDTKLSDDLPPPYTARADSTSIDSDIAWAAMTLANLIPEHYDHQLAISNDMRVYDYLDRLPEDLDSPDALPNAPMSTPPNTPCSYTEEDFAYAHDSPHQKHIDHLLTLTGEDNLLTSTKEDSLLTSTKEDNLIHEHKSASKPPDYGHYYRRFDEMIKEEPSASYPGLRAWLSLEHEEDDLITLFVGISDKEDADKIHNHILWLRDKWLGYLVAVRYHVMDYEDDAQ
jgi:hypothetical protein